MQACQKDAPGFKRRKSGDKKREMFRTFFSEFKTEMEKKKIEKPKEENKEREILAAGEKET